MIFTNVSRLGDFLLTLPVASAYYKQTGNKVHYVLSDRFPLYKKVESLVLHQECVGKVSYVDVGVDAFVDWSFNPAQFGIGGEYVNFGFPRYPDDYIPRFYGRLHGIGFDETFVLKCPLTNTTYSESTVWTKPSNYRDDFSLFQRYVKPDWVELDVSNSVETNMAYAIGSRHVVTSMGGFAILMELAGKKTNILGYRSEFARNWMYYRKEHNFIPYE